MTREEQRAGNKRIAEALGYRVERRNDAYNWLIAPDGREVEVDYHAIDTDFDDVPDYYGSLDATDRALPERFGQDVFAVMDGVTLEVKGYRARIVPFPFVYRVIENDSDFRGDGATRSEALAAALEAWALYEHTSEQMAALYSEGEEREGG